MGLCCSCFGDKNHENVKRGRTARREFGGQSGRLRAVRVDPRVGVELERRRILHGQSVTKFRPIGTGSYSSRRARRDRHYQLRLSNSKSSCSSMASQRSEYELATMSLPILWVQGGPATAKHYVTKRLAARFGLEYLSPMDIASRGSRTKKSIVQLLAEDMKKTMIEKRVQGFVLPGFPFDCKQMSEFHRLIGPCCFTLYLDCTEITMRRRMAQRYKHEHRAEDEPRIAEQRLDVFYQRTAPAIETTDAPVYQVNAEGNREDVYRSCRQIVKLYYRLKLKLRVPRPLPDSHLEDDNDSDAEEDKELKEHDKMPKSANKDTFPYQHQARNASLLTDSDSDSSNEDHHLNNNSVLSITSSLSDFGVPGLSENSRRSRMTPTSFNV